MLGLNQSSFIVAIYLEAMKLFELNVRNNIFGIIDVFYKPAKFFSVCPYDRFKRKDNEYVYRPAKINWKNGTPLLSKTIILFAKNMTLA